MANFSSDQKYLDKYGLSLFWDKVRQYIQNQIGGIDGTDVKLYPSGETNPTVTDQIEKLWNSIGSGELEGGISGSIEAILGQYVKDIQHADSQTTPLKVVVNEGTGNEADFYTVTLEDNGLANTLSDLTSNRVSSLLNPVNGGGSVTLAVDNNKGDVTLTINSQELTNKVSGLETTINGMVKSVNKVENGDGTYVKLNIDPTTGNVKLSINDQSLVSELTSIKDNYAKTEDLPTTLPNPHKFTLTYRDKENQEKVVEYDGSSAKDIDFSLYHATTSSTASKVSNVLKVIDANGTAYDYNGGVMVDLSGGINYAANSGKLGGQLPSYYGKQSDITTISQKISSIDNYTINSKKISTNPVLTGSDITLGNTVGDNNNYPTTTTLTSSIQKLRETIAGLGQVVEIKGILETLPTTTEGYGNGDVVIVGNKEYICYNSQWYLLGDTTELSQDVSTIKSSYVKSIKATGTGVTVSPTSPTNGDVTINVDATPITETIAELEANFGNYLPLSGGTMTGNLVTKQINVEAGNWVITNGQGISLQRSDGPSYIWNNTTNQSISIGTKAIGGTSEANASLVIKGTNVYPGTSNNISLGTDSYKFKDILADGRVVGGRFSTGYYSKAVLESNTNAGLSIVTQIPLNGSTAGDYGFNTTNNANGVLAFRTHAGSGANYMHYLGFSNDGEIYHTSQNAPFAGWRNLTNPFGSIRMPRDVDRFHSQAVIPSMLNEGIVNIFNYPLKSELLIERSQDGSTWVDVTDDEYENFRRGFTKGYNQGSGRYVAYDKTNGKVGDRLRITYNPSDRYCAMGYIDVYYTTSGATTTFTLEYNTKADINTWTKIHDSKSCTGWPGHNYYGLLGYNFGQANVTTKAYAYRMTFEITAINSSNNNLGIINYIYGFTAQTPYSSKYDSYFRYDVASQAYRNTGHIIPSSTGYELGNQQFPFKTVITQNLAISLGSGHTPNYITSDTNRNMFIKIADVIPFVVDCADTNNPIIRSSVYMGGKVDLGTASYPWRNVYATNFYGTAQNATNDSSGNKIVDTYALASTCYGGPEGKFAIGNSDNLIGKALTNSWGIYNENHDIIISEYDSSTETWVEKFNSATLSNSSRDNFIKGLKSSFYTSTRGSKVKLSVTSNAGAAYVQAISLYLKSKDTTYSGNIDYTYSTNSGNLNYSGTLGTWGSWCPITMSTQYRTSFEIIFNENEANAQLLINGFRIVTQADGFVPIVVGKSHESYKADTATKATQDGNGNTITSTYAKLASNNVFTAQQKVVYNGRTTLIKNGSIGFLDPNTSSWTFATSMFDTTGENTLTNICGAKGGNNEVQYVYMGGTYDKPWLKVTSTGGLTSPFISKTSGNILASWTRNLCNHTAIYGYSQTHNSCVIKTGIPVSTSKLYQMHVYGYNYQAGGQVDFTIGFYMYNGSPLRIYGVSNGTLTNPHYYIGKYTEEEVEKVCVYWTCDDSTGNNQQHYIMVDALDNSSTWSVEEYTTAVAATITNMAEASLHERMTLNKTETITGAKTFTGALNTNTNINIGSGHGINFNRNDYNYINIPTGDYSALAISKGGMAGANTIYVFNGSALFPYNNNSNDLGTSTKTWKNVYAAKFITTGGTSSQVVLGDGTLKAISDISTGGEANVQSDWNVTDTTSDAYIKNKPTIPTVGNGTITIKQNGTSKGTFTVNQTGNTTIELTDTTTGEANVQSDWNVTDTTSDAYIKNKPTITDTKVTQTVTTSNANYPILLAPSTQTTTTTGTAHFETAIKINPSTRKITGVDYISSDSTDLHIQCDEWLILDGGGDGCGIRPNSSSINDCDLGTDSIRFRNGYFSNQVFAANGFYESSDERLKDFGEGLKVDLDALSKLRKSYFTFKDKPEDPQIGVSAQEIQKLYPEVVIETSDGHLNVDYAKLSVVALAAIDQLNDKVKSLEDRLVRLEKLLENK